MKKFLLIAVLLMFAGCYKIYLNQMPDAMDMSFQQKEKIPLRAGLYMTEDFKNYTSEWEVAFGKHLFPIGRMLQDGSKRMVAAAFQDMVILSSLDEAKARKVDVVIAPEVESSEFTLGGATMLGPTISMVMIKWTASDSEGNIIWADTFEGHGQVKVEKGVKYVKRYGVSRYGVPIEYMGLAVEDSFRKAYEEMSSSGWWRKIKR
jgi:hypothetical protein